MADVSGILAALPQNQQQTNPLQIMQGVQSIVNSQQLNKLWQQELVNKQVEQQQQELNLAKSQQLMTAGLAWGLHLKGKDLSYADVQDGIDTAEKMGAPKGQLEVLRSRITPDMSGEQLSTLMGNVTLRLVGPEVASRLIQPLTEWETSGQVKYPMLIPPVGNMEGRPAGVPYLAPGFQGIGAPGGIQQYPTPEWQPGVTPGGRELQTPSPPIQPSSLTPFAQPVVLPSAGAGATQPPPAATTQPPPATTVQPPPAATTAIPAAGTQVTQGPVTSGGFNVSRLSPEEVTANALSAQKFQQALDFNSNYAQTNRVNLGALEALRNADTGPGARARAKVEGFIATLSPDIARRFGIDPNKLDWMAQADKYLTQRTAMMGAQAQTDLARYEKDLANPNIETQKQAAIHLHQMNTAFDNMQEAAIRTYMNLPQNQGRTISDPDVQAGFLRYQTNYMNSHDYRAYMPQTVDERLDTINGITDPDEQKNFIQSQRDAKMIGVKPTP